MIKGEEMKKRMKIVLPVAVLTLLLISFGGCKNFGSPDYTLTVVIEDGCTGTPEAGTYTLDELEEIEFEYLPPEEDIVIEVLINDSLYGESGSFIMYNNITLIVRILDIRGNWLLSYTRENDNDKEITVTFSGDTPFGGTFTDSDGHNGIWTVESDDLTMTYSDWADYVFTGSISSMTGNYIGEGVQLIWTAVRSD